MDCDALARAAVEPGEPSYDAVLERFGPQILARGHVGGRAPVDRARLASIVFTSAAALADLEAIVHPVVQARARDVLRGHAATDDVVVIDLALLEDRFGQRHFRFDGVLVVDAPEDVALERLVRHRRMGPADARARMAAQPDRAELARAADCVVMNAGTLEELDERVERAWAWIEQLRAERRGAPRRGDAGSRRASG